MQVILSFTNRSVDFVFFACRRARHGGWVSAGLCLQTSQCLLQLREGRRRNWVSPRHEWRHALVRRGGVSHVRMWRRRWFDEDTRLLRSVWRRKQKLQLHPGRVSRWTSWSVTSRDSLLQNNSKITLIWIHVLESPGYHLVVKIPAGATHIRIEDKSFNFLGSLIFRQHINDKKFTKL